MHLPTKLISLACATTLLLIPARARANDSGPAESESSPTTEAPAMAKPAPAPAPPAPSLDDSLTLTGSNLWSGLEQATVSLSLRNGEHLEGTVVAQDRDKLALARASDGSVVAVPKQEIEGVRLVATAGANNEATELPLQARRPTDDGRKLYGAGVGMLAAGIPIGVAGTALLGIFLSVPYIHLPVLIPGIGLIIGGSVAIKRSHRRHDAYRRAWGLPPTTKLRLAPTFGVGRNGGELGLVMRF